MNYIFFVLNTEETNKSHLFEFSRKRSFQTFENKTKTHRQGTPKDMAEDSLRQEVLSLQQINKDNAQKLENLESLLKKANEEVKEYKLKHRDCAEEVRTKNR